MHKHLELTHVRNERKRNHDSAGIADIHEHTSLRTFLTLDRTTFENVQPTPKRQKKQHADATGIALVKLKPKKRATRASILCLPDELLLIILECLGRDVRTLCTLARTCHRIYRLCTLDLIWRPVTAGLYRPTTRRHVKCYGQAPQNDLLSFLRNLACSDYCFRCGVKATSKTELGAMGEKVLEVLSRRYCKGCQSTEFINKTDAKERFLVTEKQLAAAKYVPKPWYGKQSYLYLESTIEQLSLERWGSERALKEAKSERKPRNKTPRDFWHKFYDPFFYEYFDDHRYILPPYFGPPATSAQTNAITVHHPAANVTVSKTTDTAGVITFGNVSVNISIGAPNPTSGVSHHNHQAVVGSGSGSGPGSSSGPAGAQGYVAVNGGGAYFSLSVNVAGGW